MRLRLPVRYSTWFKFFESQIKLLRRGYRGRYSLNLVLKTAI